MKKDNTVFNDLQASLKQAVAIRQGKMPPSRVFKVETVDVKATREKTHMSQTEFAKAIHVSVRTLQNWEQGHRNPTGPAMALLKIVASAPDIAVRALRTA
ncbi:DNA-binding protein [Bordetella pertussis]|uniref:DNA-binding helix-turn-helix protein n=2 Tax=Bordetella pertussis TaxID=520 RepID=A0AAI9NGF6_BORPT|nr:MULTISPECIES: NadS family protein [Bordetella]ETH38619.1 DNA-binding helix-turn-helix protein [Bordetella pertussis H918]ETH45553.1 DNA-binding helix-turn-helix protein [Bordetella pertussis H921]ETH69618.1 DNA-binding helix-turn-helix protein [Bordetella pertussis STO1-CHLA-0011]ETH83116.1 DNA-binding helix-turn-helix protein [Bordetella pertussis STO1-CHOC-0017]ETH87692.1 DNA-binding helix-turn-helix protein [Bordetella pertussis STO1-CHOC-0018]ETH92186.1 DNA-binding helix-turn-helix pro